MLKKTIQECVYSTLLCEHMVFNLFFKIKSRKKWTWMGGGGWVIREIIAQPLNIPHSNIKVKTVPNKQQRFNVEEIVYTNYLRCPQ